jgi:hypothetical protein
LHMQVAGPKIFVFMFFFACFCFLGLFVPFI